MNTAGLEGITGNQAVQLLWLHYHGPTPRLELDEQEVKHLELELVAQWGDLKKSPYVKQLITDDKETFISYLLDNPCKSVFKR